MGRKDTAIISAIEKHHKELELQTKYIEIHNFIVWIYFNEIIHFITALPYCHKDLSINTTVALIARKILEINGLYFREVNLYSYRTLTEELVYTEIERDVLTIYLYTDGIDEYMTTTFGIQTFINFNDSAFKYHDTTTKVLPISSLILKYLILAERVSSKVSSEIITLSSILNITVNYEENERWRNIVPILDLTI